jgi:hypothetical protein
MAARPKTYAQAQQVAQDALAAARLADPDEHFPYKHEEALAALDADTPMGPGTPDGIDGAADTSRTIADYLTRAIVDASAAYVAAQEAYLRDRNEDTLAEYERTRDELVATRLDHRQNRGTGFTIGAAARRAG